MPCRSAEGQAVIVAVAYRLSLFVSDILSLRLAERQGFLASTEISSENENGCAGNFGFME